jgi:hypothetical protein
MFDLVSTAELTASAAIFVFFLSSMLSSAVRRRALVAAAFAGWFILVLFAGATGALSATAGIGAPGLGLAVVIPVLVLGGFVLGTARGRDLVGRTPLAALVGVHSVRVLGISFVLLYLAKRLPAPFALAAGWGDVAVGVLAIPLALWLTRDAGAVPRGLVRLWNALGVMDLVIAVGLGTTSSPGPLQLFHGEPSSAIMTTVPWILIPCFLVPSMLFTHLCTFYRLRMPALAARGEKLHPVGVPASGL